MRIAFLSIVVLLSCFCSAQSGSEKEITALVDRFFQAMADRDTLALNSIMTDDGIFHSVAPGRPARSTTHDQFIRDIGMAEGKILERYWEPEIWVGEGIATLHAEYDLHFGGKFSHCGTDVFLFVQTADGWQISGGVFNMKREGCGNIRWGR